MKTVKAPAIPPESEAYFQAFVIALARRLGWASYHTFDSRHSQGGFPDLVLVRCQRLLFVELKSEKGKISPEQQTWIDMLAFVPGVEAYFWRPSQKLELADILR